MIEIEQSAAAQTPRRALFAYGFRPFFLLAGLFAATSPLFWLFIWYGWIEFAPVTMPSLWHAHEMVFGFAVAAIAGFLLTAVPNWTALGPIRGGRLMLLTGMWLAGRVLALMPGESTAPLYAAVDLAFLPLLAAFVAPSIVMRSARRNGVFLVFPAILFVANLAYHGEALDWDVASAAWGVRLAIGVLLVMIAVVGGRIVPAFTIGGMRMAGRPVAIEPAPRLDIVAILSLVVMVALEASGAEDVVIAAAAAVAAVLHAARLARWQGWKAGAVPLVVILHVGYAWLVVGLALKAVAGLSDVAPNTAALHALTTGCIASMILAVMSRASLGHTGRPLVAGRLTVVAYALVTLGAALRTLSPILAPDLPLLGLAGLTWSGGFAVFVAVYWPILLRPRPDGRPG
ncbi:MAG: NnrS family protein [Proteobacteria bacterium]|nr:NnrS family protein [Pseudomonadota bacterium]